MEHRPIPQDSWAKKTLKRVGLAAGLLVAAEKGLEHTAHANKPIAAHTGERDPAHDAAAGSYLEGRIKRRQDDGAIEAALINTAEIEDGEKGLLSDKK